MEANQLPTNAPDPHGHVKRDKRLTTGTPAEAVTGVVADQGRPRNAHTTTNNAKEVVADKPVLIAVHLPARFAAMMVELRDATGAGEADILRAAIGLRVMRCTRDELGQVPLETCTARDGTVLPTATALTNLATHGQYRQFDHLMFRQDDYTEGSSRLTIRLTKKWAGYWETVCNEELLNSGLAKSDLVRDLLGDLYDRYRLVQRGYQPTVTVIAGNTQTQYGLFDLLGLKVRELV